MKKLTLALVAFLAVGASAQARHYETRDGMVTATPSGIYETRVVEVMPVRVMPVTTPTRIFVVPSSSTEALNVRYYDTADTTDELRDLKDDSSTRVYQVEETRIIHEHE